MATSSDANRLPKTGSQSSAIVRGGILVLSGYLLGGTAAHIGSPLLEECWFAAGMIGLIAYFALVSRSQRKRARHARRAIETATVKLEQRIERQVRAVSARLLLKVHRTNSHSWPHEQYVTVVRSAGAGR